MLIDCIAPMKLSALNISEAGIHFSEKIKTIISVLYEKKNEHNGNVIIDNILKVERYHFLISW